MLGDEKIYKTKYKIKELVIKTSTSICKYGSLNHKLQIGIKSHNNVFIALDFKSFGYNCVRIRVRQGARSLFKEVLYVHVNM